MTNIKIADEALDDLNEGFWFCLKLTAGIHRVQDRDQRQVLSRFARPRQERLSAHRPSQGGKNKRRMG